MNTSTQKVTWSKVKKLIAKSEYAYIYSDGSLLMMSLERVRGRDVRIYTRVKNFVEPWHAYYWKATETMASTRIEQPARLIWRMKGALTVARPVRLEVYAGNGSTISRQAGVAGVGVRVQYDNGAVVAFEYLSTVLEPRKYDDTTTWGSYLLSSDWELQTNIADDTVVDEAFDLRDEEVHA